MPELLRVSDLRPLIELGGQLGELEPDLGVRIEHMLRGLCHQLGAFSAFATISTPDLARRAGAAVWYFGHEDAHQRTALEQIRRVGGPPDPTKPGLLARLQHANGRPVTVLREQVLQDSIWYASHHAMAVRRPSGVDHCLYSLLPISEANAVATVILHRAWGDRQRFSERERQLLQAFHEGVRWLYQPRAMALAQRVAALAPRQREALKHVKRGLSEKQVAEAMDLSPHTVHEYLADLYRRMGVRCRRELLSLWLDPAAAMGGSA